MMKKYFNSIQMKVALFITVTATMACNYDNPVDIPNTIGVEMTSLASSKALATVTTSEIGWRIGSDGMAYEPTGNLPMGVTAVAMIGYISSIGHGLAIELNNNPSKVAWADASKTATTDKPTIAGGMWRLASYDDWFNILVGCAVAGDKTAFPKEGETALNPVRGFKQKWQTTGFTLDETDKGRIFWTSTEVLSTSAKNVWLTFYNTTALAWFAEGTKTSNNYVLACLEF